MKNRSLRYIAGLLLLILVLSIMSGCGMVRSLGKNPEGAELARLEALPNYKNGRFQNRYTVVSNNLVKGKRGFRIFSLFTRPDSIKPVRQLPWAKTDLKALTATRPTVTWFGHSSVLIKANQTNILIDPIFSNHAGPIPGIIEAFKGSDHYTAGDMPDIDALIISHDHYDHLDYRTAKKLKNRVKMIVVPLGVGAHFRYWGFDPKRIIELNWDQSIELPGGIKVTATPAHHRSNRTFSAESKTLWASYVINVDNYKLYYSGDSGYSPHFKQIGTQYGPFDLALLECGQYNLRWPSSHMMPHQTAQAGADLQARLIQPVHWAKFAESDHYWNEPIKLLLPDAKKLGVEVSTPLIGEPYVLGTEPKRQVWWDFD